MAQVLRHLTPSNDPRLIIGAGDDAAAYLIHDDEALIVTADFFTPIVNSARDWGRIAAANALSDVYAMGGEPLLCLNLAAWPSETLPLDLLGEVLAGGDEVARAAGAVVAGGHTVDDAEPKYGMAVVGRAHPDHLIRTDAARAGDVLVLTKPIGTGVITTALKAGAAPAASVEAAVESMVALNADAARAAVTAGVRAGTDVTGFGLLGHLRSMCAASGVSATIDAGSVPLLPGVRALAEAGHIPSGTGRNLAFLEPYLRAQTDPTTTTLLADAQTSGGLLLCVRPDTLDGLTEDLRARGLDPARIGTLTPGPVGEITLL